MAFNRPDPNASLADYKEHVAQKRTKIDKAIANAQAFQKQRTALMNMSTKEKLGAALEVGIVGLATGMGNSAIQSGSRAVVNKVITQPSNRIGRAMAENAFEVSLNRISQMPLNPGNKIKGTRATVVTPAGVSEGTSTFRVTPSRTTSQMEGTIKGQVTRASKEASKIGSYSSEAAKQATKNAYRNSAAVVGGAAVIKNLIDKYKK